MTIGIGNPKRRSIREPERFAREAKSILRALMARHGYSYKRLVAALDPQDGPVEDVQTLTNKVNRGRFSFALLLRLCRAMGVSSVDLASVEAAEKSGRKPVGGDLAR